MGYLAGALIAVVLTLVVLLYRQQRAHEADTLEREARNTEERAELLTRIQRPELIPRRVPTRPTPAPDPDAPPSIRAGEVRPVQADDVVSDAA